MSLWNWLVQTIVYYFNLPNLYLYLLLKFANFVFIDRSEQKDFLLYSEELYQ